MHLRPKIYHDYLLRVQPAYREILSQCDEDLGLLNEIVGACFARGAASVGVGLTLLSKYRKCGQQVFVLGPKIQELFGHTDLKGVRKDYLKPPYDCFYIAIPGNKDPIWGGDHTRWHPVDGVLVYFHADGFILYLWGDENGLSRAPGDDSTYWFGINFHQVGDMDLESYVENKLRNFDNNISRAIPGHRGIEVAIEIPDDEKLNVIVNTAIKMVRMTINTILYLNSHGAETAPDPHSERIKREIRQLEAEAARKKRSKAKKLLNKANRKRALLSPSNIVWIAPSIEQDSSGDRKTIQRSPRVRHWVRGHYRRLPSGKLCWVRPYERCKDAFKTRADQPRQYRFRE